MRIAAELKRDRKNKKEVTEVKKKQFFQTILEQSWEDAHFFLSSADNWECCLRIDRPQPAVMVPSLEKALFTIGELGTLFGLKNAKVLLKTEICHL